ncbi:MAG: endonuclease domain-containing protein [Devosia sp.]
MLPSPLWGEGGSTKSSRVRGRKLAPEAVAKARTLRRVPTDAERRMWNMLRNRSVQGMKFLRQFPIGPFVVDFVCRELMLVIEVDGNQHADDRTYDDRRTAFLNSRGYSVLRFWNNEVLQHLDGVHEMIAGINSGVVPAPSPGWRFTPATLSPEGRGDQTAMQE